MDNNKLFELMEKMYSEVIDIKKEVNDHGKKLLNIETDVSSLKKGQLKLEDRLEDARKTLFDGYKQNSEQLSRIEKEVSKHEEIILRRIK